jgi:hypothetical protein
MGAVATPQEGLMRVLPGLASLVLASSLPAQTVLFSEGFENGLANWNATGLWHVESAADPCAGLVLPFPEGSHCAYYGLPSLCNYDTGATNNGNLTLTTPIPIPANAVAPRLHCWTRHQTEGCTYLNNFDNFWIQVSADGGAHWTVVGSRCDDFGLPAPNDAWNPRGIPLDAYRGSSILLRFRFDTFDDVANIYLGAFVDKIEVRVEAGSTFCTDTCPCVGPFNNTAMGYGNMTGCGNSGRKQAELAAGGAPSVANDSVVLTASQLVSPTTVLFLQADGHDTGSFNGDGRLCLTGGTSRLAIRASSTGAVSLPGPGDPSLSTMGAVPLAGATRHYTAVYRDSADYWCTSATVNHTNGYAIVWTP